MLQNRLGSTLDEEAFRTHLDDIGYSRKKKIGQQAHYLLQTSYLDYAVNNEDEIEELFAQYCRV